MSSKPNSESSRQIKQMVNFIMQEAHEKVNEIRIKVKEDLTFMITLMTFGNIISPVQTEHDFNIEKQNLVHNGKLKVQEDYTQKQKDLEVEQRV